MAKATFKMPDDFLMKVSKLADKTDEILPKVLEAGAKVVESKVRSNLSARDRQRNEGTIPLHRAAAVCAWHFPRSTGQERRFQREGRFCRTAIRR